jgi:hypothetical protein
MRLSVPTGQTGVQVEGIAMATRERAVPSVAGNLVAGRRAAVQAREWLCRDGAASKARLIKVKVERRSDSFFSALT